MWSTYLCAHLFVPKQGSSHFGEPPMHNRRRRSTSRTIAPTLGYLHETSLRTICKICVLVTEARGENLLNRHHGFSVSPDESRTRRIPSWCRTSINPTSALGRRWQPLLWQLCHLLTFAFRRPTDNSQTAAKHSRRLSADKGIFDLNATARPLWSLPGVRHRFGY